MIRFTFAACAKRNRRSLPQEVHSRNFQPEYTIAVTPLLVFDLIPQIELKNSIIPKTLSVMKTPNDERRKKTKNQSSRYQNRILVLNKSIHSMISITELLVPHQTKISIIPPVSLFIDANFIKPKIRTKCDRSYDFSDLQPHLFAVLHCPAVSAILRLNGTLPMRYGKSILR